MKYEHITPWADALPSLLTAYEAGRKAFAIAQFRRMAELADKAASADLPINRDNAMNEGEAAR